MKKALLAVVVVFCASGCNRLMRTAYPPPYLKAVDAASTVLARHYIITNVDRDNGIVHASGIAGANMFTKYRTRVEARAYRLPNDTYDIEMRVINELEVSEPCSLGLARPQPGHDWRAVGFDHVLEAALTAEVQNEIRGVHVMVPPMASYVMFPQPPLVPMNHAALFPWPPAPPNGKTPPPPPPAPNPLAPAPKPPEPPKPQSAAPERSAGIQLFDQYMALGDQYLRRHEHDRALLEYQRATLAQPRNPVPHLSLAGIWTVLGRYGTGAEALRQAAAAADGQPIAGTDIQRLRGLTEDANQRVLLLKGWCRQNPGDRDARLLLGYQCLLADRLDEARSALQEILQADPKDSAASYLLRQADGRRS